MQRLKTLKSWSYSSLSTYEKCAKKLYFEKVKRLPKKSSQALERGNEIHSKGEKFLKKELLRVPKEYKEFAPELNRLRKMGAEAEAMRGLDKNWNSVPWDDWNNCWLRYKTDAEVMVEPSELLIVDFKTGKMYDTHEDQAKLYAAAALSSDPTLSDVHVEFWYLDHDNIEGFAYKQKDSSKFQSYWNRRVKPMLSDVTFKAKPSPSNCRWCDYKESCEESIL